MASYKSTVQGQYASYLLQKEQEAASVAQWQREWAAQQELQRQQAAAQAASGSSYSSGGYGNGGLTASQVAEMQRFYNVDADGVWGPQSSARVGGLTAEEAWDAYQKVKQQRTAVATPALRGAGIF